MIKSIPISKCDYCRSSKSIALILIAFVGLLAVACITSIIIELLPQQEVDLLVFKHALGDSDNDQGKQMEILPCDPQHECKKLG